MEAKAGDHPQRLETLRPKFTNLSPGQFVVESYSDQEEFRAMWIKPDSS